MLSLQNFNVITAENGKQAIDIYEQNQDIKLVLTDYNMPEMDGFNLTLALRKLQPKEQLSIIGLSASGKNDLGAQFIKNGANDFITKPVAYEELLCRVNQNISMLEYMEALRYAANRDFLTGLYNRRYFFGEGESLYNLAVEIKGLVTVAMIDIDHFKKVNDTYGHEVGDEMLVFFSNQLSEYFSDELVARIGGEEFALLFTQLDKSKVFERLDTFRQAIADSVIQTHDLSLSMSVSIGMHDLLEGNLDGMLKIADEKLYDAKENGRNKVVC
jgi:diguanylate cyclase (GGDEF)-like protein